LLARRHHAVAVVILAAEDLFDFVEMVEQSLQRRRAGSFAQTTRRKKSLSIGRRHCTVELLTGHGESVWRTIALLTWSTQPRAADEHAASY
jgi:hypothetical protein